MEQSAGVRDAFDGAFSAVEENLLPKLEELRDQVEALNARALKTLKSHPALCLAGVLAAGFLLGRIASRR